MFLALNPVSYCAPAKRIKDRAKAIHMQEPFFRNNDWPLNFSAKPLVPENILGEVGGFLAEQIILHSNQALSLGSRCERQSKRALPESP